MQFSIYAARCAGNEKNTSYPVCRMITGPEELMEAIKFDHVASAFKDNIRNNSNFISSNVAVLDLDNDATDDEQQWVNLDQLKEVFAGIAVAVVTSRNHMKVKNGKTARPKYHLYFPIRKVDVAAVYADIKKRIRALYPFFDGNALDAARFLYGVDGAEAYWQEGTNIDETLSAAEVDEFADWCEEHSPDSPIPVGSRNSTLSKYAFRALVRLGDTPEAEELFRKKAASCACPLSDEELENIWRSAKRGYAMKVANTEGYIPPDEYGAGSMVPDDFSDQGEAAVMARIYGEVLKYSPQTDFLCYTGRYWQEDKVAALGLEEKFLDEQLEDARTEVATTRAAAEKAGVPSYVFDISPKKALEEVEDSLRPALEPYLAAVAYKNFVMKHRDTKYLLGTLQAVKPMVQLDPALLDANEMMLNTPAGTYDLRKGTDGLLTHNPKDLITKITSVSPGSEGEEIWNQALDVFFCGDKDLIGYVQLIMGAAIIGKVFVEYLVIAIGSGRNGKSSFFNACAGVLGSYSGNLSADTLVLKNMRNTKPELAELRGKRLVIAAELQEGMVLNTSMVKQLTSTDQVFAEKKYKAPMAFSPSHHVVLFTNYLPKVRSTDDGTWRRLVVVPFNAVIEENEAEIKNFGDYLINKAGPAILAWLIEGAKKALACGFSFKQPDCVVKAIASYRKTNDWMGKFLEECCFVDESYICPSGELYYTYRQYCTVNGEFTRSTTDFYQELERLGFERKTTKKGKFIKGLMLKVDDLLS